MDIDGCGEGNLQKLIDAGLVKSAADLYDLTVEQLLPLGKKVDVWANNLVRSIEASKTRDLSRLLFAFRHSACRPEGGPHPERPLRLA